MTNAVEICNRALLRCGHSPIDSLDDLTRAGKLAKAEYENMRREKMSGHPWDFATQQVDLGPELVGTEPLDVRYDQRHALPAGWGWVRSIWQEGKPVSDWRVFGNTVMIVAHSDEQPVAEITFDMDEDTMPGFFIDCLVAEMTYIFCAGLTGKAELTADFFEKAEIKWARARRQSAQMKSPPRVYRRNRFILARN